MTLFGLTILAGAVLAAGCTPSQNAAAKQNTGGGALPPPSSGPGNGASIVQAATPTGGAEGSGTSRPSTVSALKDLLAGQPAQIRNRILAEPDKFIGLLRQVLAEPHILVELVDKQHALPADYAPTDLIRLRDYNVTINRNNLELRKAVMGDLMRMVRAARSDGIELALSSTYRSYSYQKELFARNVAELGLKEAERESARPGTSQHQLGTTIDFGSITPEFAQTASGKWLAAHAWEYGFTMSYPPGQEVLTGYMYEPWHFRYIGIPAARMEHLYFDGIQQRLLLFLHDHRSELEKLAAQ